MGWGKRWWCRRPTANSGHTTFFVANEGDWNRSAAAVRRERAVKVMKRIRCRSLTQEACLTRWGTIVGPLQCELIGLPEADARPGRLVCNEAGDWPGVPGTGVAGPLLHPEAGGTTAAAWLSGLLRRGLLDRPGHGRALPGRDQPSHFGRNAAHEFRLRRFRPVAARSVSFVGV